MTCGDGMRYYSASPLFDFLLSDVAYEPRKKSRFVVYEPRNRWTAEKDGTIFGKIELPGVKKEDIQVDFKDQGLSVKAVRRWDSEIYKEEADHKKSTIKETETTDGKHAAPKEDDDIWKNFEVEVVLPKTANVESIHAKYSNGVLTLAIPKLPEEEPRKIEIA